MKHAAIYLRVSTEDQSTDMQSSDLIAYAKARGFEFKIYEDKLTGTNANRPALTALLKDARERKIDVVLCWKLDRFFRSLKDLVNTLQELDELGVAFVSLKDNIDLSTSAGRLMMHMLGAFAQFEADLIRERVRAGVKRAREKGKRLGRPCVTETAKVIDLRKNGHSIREIARQLGVSRGAIERAIRT